MSSPSSRPPAGVPRSGGNTMYAVVAFLLVLGIGAIIGMRSCSKRPEAVASIPSSTVAQAPEPPPNPKLDDIPPPPPPEQTPEAGPAAPRLAVAPSAGCDSRCAGISSPELEQALAIRGQQARRCYNQALTQDSSLKGHVSIAIRIGPTGNVCSATVATNDMGTPGVANCAANIFRQSGSFPSPRGGCINATVPLSFVPTGH